MKKCLALLLSGVVAFSACVTPLKEKPAVLEEIVAEEEQTEPPELIFSEENRYHWTAEQHKEESVIYYNPSIATLDYGLRNGSLILDWKEDERKVDEARIKIYKIEDRIGFTYQSVIEFRFKGEEEWHETSKYDPEYNLDFNFGDSGGVYIVGDLVYWPDDPFDALFFKPTQ